RYLTVALGAGQAYGFTVLFQNTNPAILPALDWFPRLEIILTLTAGTVMLMWFGELITEYGIGNGVSLLIFAGIIGRGPQGGAAGHVVLPRRQLDQGQLRARHPDRAHGDHVQRALPPVHVRLHVLLHGDHVRGERRGGEPETLLELQPRHPSGQADGRLPGGGDEPGHVRGRHLPRLHHRDPAHRHGQDLRHPAQPDVSRRYGDPDRRRRRPRHHETAADAAGDAPVPRLHQVAG